ncbi:serine hydrolase domain-containing protein [Streptomyces sp. uw30]|uniref:serine hydrolase domain-containing protein n=1 Tax=Streptomyces sp. uw30 TaxID=1828179 RepID=UPI0029059CBD|nr:serine hydrolase [Streptomyces sp. uw30]
MNAYEPHPVHGWTDSGYEGVRAAFADVIDAQPEAPGQQLAVYRDGRLVVDLWAGPEVDGDSLFGVYSVSKGAVFMVVALLVQDGVLDLNREVAAYWPEFGQAGKEDITLRQLLAHQAGVIGIDEHFTVEELADDRVLAERLAAQKPYWKPGTAFGYHGLVIGALVGEVVRRATGRTLHDWWEHRVRRPHGLGFHLGLPQDLEPRYRPMRPAAPEPGQITAPEDPRRARTWAPSPSAPGTCPTWPPSRTSGASGNSARARRAVSPPHGVRRERTRLSSAVSTGLRRCSRRIRSPRSPGPTRWGRTSSPRPRAGSRWASSSTTSATLPSAPTLSATRGQPAPPRSRAHASASRTPTSAANSPSATLRTGRTHCSSMRSWLLAEAGSGECCLVASGRCRDR